MTENQSTHIMSKPITYKSLSGYTCETKSRRFMNYPKTLTQLFIDPISLEHYNLPTLIREYPDNVYDRNSLIKWLSISDVEPMTGVKIGKKILKFLDVINFQMAMLLLEEKDDQLVFHIPEIDLINLSHLTIDMNKAKNVPGTTIYLDLDYYTDTLQPLEHYTTYNLGDILIRDIFTGKKITDPVLTQRGLYLDQTTIREEPEFRSFSLEQPLGRYLEDFRIESVDFNIGFNKIVDPFDKLKIKEKVKPPRQLAESSDSKLFDFCKWFKEDQGLKLRDGDFYLQATTTEEHILEQLEELLSNTTRYQNFSEKRTYLSNLVRKNLDLLTDPHKGCGGGVFDHIRHEIGFPVLNDLRGCYADDFSLLDLSSLEFIGDSTDIKAYEFIGTDFSNTRLEGFKFSLAAFIGSDLTNTTFSGCQFDRCSFEGAKFGCDFEYCEMDDWTKKNIIRNQNAYIKKLIING